MTPFPALCNGDLDGGGWIVIQKRFDGSINFNRSWTEFRNGFGQLHGEFFIGLDKLHHITNTQPYELYIQVEEFMGEAGFASYDNFKIGNEASQYKLESLGDFRGTLSNQMMFGMKQKFTTYDHQNDQTRYIDCDPEWFGAWWHKDCNGP
ncbi:uncharacterized protein Dwil_GK28265 [Drosophila willistoni]|uniref:Fibrinogen C-terminal domain-containing protein n=1 Tax=Drosophila willistoni TaxID=7260 RepID=A0A0Q9WQT0_DROWI|nr:uncharacterized protein Dwil_GK28265 [Drosophila willistoni]